MIMSPFRNADSVVLLLVVLQRLRTYRDRALSAILGVKQKGNFSKQRA